MAEPIPAGAFYDLATPRELAVSPDGGRVAYVISEADREADEHRSSLFVVPVDGGEPAHRLTRLSGAKSPRWSRDGSQLAFLAERDVDLGRPTDAVDPEEAEEADPSDADLKTQVWAFDLQRGGDARQLTAREHGVREFDWAPNGDRLVISARDPTEEQEAAIEQRDADGPIEIHRLQHKADGIGYTDEVTTYLFTVDLSTGEEHRLDQAFGAGVMEPTRGLDPRWNPATEEIAFVTTDAERPDETLVSDVFIVEADSGTVSRITDGGSMYVRPEWSPNGKHLTASGRDAENWYAPADVIVAEPATGDWHSITGEFDPTVTWFEMPRFIDNETVLGGFGDHGWSRFYRLPSREPDPTPLDLDLDPDRSIRQFDVAGGTLAYSITDPSRGHDFFAVDVGDIRAMDVAPTRLTDLNRAFVDEWPMPSFRRIRTSSDGVSIESMCYYPDTFDPEDPEPHPSILSVHGGPMDYDDPQFNFPVSFFTSRGYLVCKPNYRGSTSYGREFADALRGECGTVEVSDLLSVVDDLVSRGWAAPERLFSMGFSYGAIAAIHLLARTDRFTAAVAEHGTYDLRSDFGTSDYHAWMSTEYGLPWEQPERYDEGSAILQVEKIDTPVLLTAGGEDLRCPSSQSEQLYVSLRKRGVPTNLIIYPDLNHHIGNPSQVVHRLEAMAEWFEDHNPILGSS